MSIVVTKSSPVVVCPSEPATATGNIQLSSFDNVGGSSPVSSLLVFDTPIDDPVKTIKRGLSRALVHYHAISGRLAAGADGSEVITCTGEGQGVLFVGASASCAVDDLLSSTAPLNDLLVHYPEVFRCLHADPLLLVQVTEFSCGGFTVGLTWNHVLGDAAGMGQFMQAVGELARGMSLPSVVPAVRSDDTMLAAHLPGITFMDFLSLQPTMGMAFLDLTIPSSLIASVKAEVSSALGDPCTTFDAVVALLWKCRARAIIRDDRPESPATIIFVSDVRGTGLVGAAGGYYGNCCIMESVQATCAEVANGDTKDVVKLIRMVKHKIQDHVEKGDGVVVEPGQQHQQRQPYGYNTLLVSSWRNIGLEAPDFGGGRPARVIWYLVHGILPTFVLCPPCKGKDGVNVLGYAVRKEHADAFMHEIREVGGVSSLWA